MDYMFPKHCFAIFLLLNTMDKYMFEMLLRHRYWTGECIKVSHGFPACEKIYPKNLSV